MLFLLLALAQAQNAAEDPQCVAYTGSFTSMRVQDIQSSYMDTITDDDCHPTTYDGSFVEITGTVTAVGATKNSYTAGYFYIQDCDDNTMCPPFSAIEVFHENHADNVARGDIIRVRGRIEENGATVIVACTYEKIGVGTAVSPMMVTTDAFPMPYNPETNPAGHACTNVSEGYEHMLVTVTAPVVQCCMDAHGYTNGDSYADRCQGNINVDWAPVWDVYKQYYVITDGDSSLLDIDNHMFSTFTKYYTRCNDDFNTADQFESITGIVGWWNGDSRTAGRWDLAPRDEFDIAGATEIDTTQVVTRTIAEIKNAMNTGLMFGNDYDAIPVNLIGSDEVNSDGLQGTGCDGAAHFTTGSCPRTDVRGQCAFYPQAICNCYPLNTYSSVAAAGSEYMFVYGVVNHVQDPTGPFYMEDDCGVGNGLYVYRNDADQAVSAGDRIEMIAKAYHYYGLDELTDPITVNILSSNEPLCPAAEITAAPFQSTGHGDCTEEAELIEGTHVTMKDVTVTKIFNSYCIADDPDMDGIEYQTDWSSRFCGCDDGRCWGAFLQSYWDGALGFKNDTYTPIEIEDSDGNKMVLDQAGNDQTATPLTPYYLGEVPGFEGQTLKVGDTFASITGFVDHRRGSYKMEYGGYHAFIVKEIQGWNEPPADDGGSGSKKSKAGLKGGALIAVIVVLVVACVVISAVCLVLGAKYHKAVESNTKICKPQEHDPNAKLELVDSSSMEEAKQGAKTVA